MRARTRQRGAMSSPWAAARRGIDDASRSSITDASSTLMAAAHLLADVLKQDARIDSFDPCRPALEKNPGGCLATPFGGPGQGLVTDLD